MSEWTDDVLNDAEADEARRRRKDMRRAILGGVAGVAMLVGPIILANAMVPDDDESNGDVEIEGETAAPIANLLSPEAARAADAARASAAESMRTTTAPPPPPTEPPPPPTEPPPPETTTTEAPPETTAPPEPPSSGEFGDPYWYGTWDELAQCESGGNWEINTGNGYYGGLQFSLSSWRGVGGEGYPHENSREVQIQMGIRLYESSGWGAWPACTRRLGLR